MKALDVLRQLTEFLIFAFVPNFLSFQPFMVKDRLSAFHLRQSKSICG